MNKMAIRNLLLLLFLTFNLNAGDYRYSWANIGDFGLGEIDNKLLIYNNDEVYFTSIPAFETYWKWYLLWFVVITCIVIFVRRKKRLNTRNNPYK